MSTLAHLRFGCLASLIVLIEVMLEEGDMTLYVAWIVARDECRDEGMARGEVRGLKEARKKGLAEKAGLLLRVERWQV